jgi:hypothetical protein
MQATARNGNGKSELTEQITVRLSKSDLAILDQIAAAWRCKQADVVRRALCELFAKNSFLTDDEKKALGVSG